MQKILITSLAAYWTIVFAVGAFGAAGLSAYVHAPGLLDTALAVGQALVALLFCWTALAASSHTDDATRDVARLAIGAAVLVCAALAAREAAAAGMLVDSKAYAMQVAGLAATYLVMHVEAVAERKPRSVDYSNAVARRLAVGAAHGSMLSRLSRRGPEIAESDG